MEMGKKKNGSSKRAWGILRMALLWARKGGVFKRWTLVELRGLVPKFLRALSHHHHRGRDDYLSRYGERELSFDETPIFHVKMHRPSSMRFLLPCISPHDIDFDYDFHDDDDAAAAVSYGYDDDRCDKNPDICAKEEEENGINARAEEFIANFYEQIKLQRQISYLQYQESNSDGRTSV